MEEGNYYSNVDNVLSKEKDHGVIKDPKHPQGLAISGGGIRSASFGLGAMQALVAEDKLKDMDYMSTVSGGGFLGSALTWALHNNGNEGWGETGTSKKNFPLGSIDVHGKDNKGDSKDCKGDKWDYKDGSNPQIDGSQFLNFLRQHGNYLMPISELGVVSLAAVAIRGIFSSLMVYFSLLLVLMSLLIWSGFLATPDTARTGVSIKMGVACFVLYLLLSLWYSLNTGIGKNRVRAAFYKFKSWLYKNSLPHFGKYGAFIKGQMYIGLLWKVGIICFSLSTFPYVVRFLKDLIPELATGSTLLGIAQSLWQYKKAQSNDKSSGTFTNIAIFVGAFCLLFGLLLGSYYIAQSIIVPCPVLVIIPILLMTVLGLIVNLNLIGPHRIWRNRLMELYMPNVMAIKCNKWSMATDADQLYLQDIGSSKKGRASEGNIGSTDHRRPYHILNTNVLLGGSKHPKYNGRGGDNFILSPLYCGSDATGWRKTDAMHEVKGSKTGHKKDTTDPRNITLATAMAASSAAVNPNADVSGEGFMRSRTVSILLSLLNLRLGYWIANPKKSERRWKIAPNFFYPGIATEIYTPLLNEKASLIQLSDGGHFENLGLYELIRRKLTTIVLVDGAADAKFNFDDLSNAIEKVRVDFGVKIQFGKEYGSARKDAQGNEITTNESYGLDDLLPGSHLSCKDADHEHDNEHFSTKYQFAKRGFAEALITYYDEERYEEGEKKGEKKEIYGRLYYVKLTMVEGLPQDVYSYKGKHPEFPHQSTADQFFDEKQFEAYRELGYHITRRMINQAMKS